MCGTCEQVAAADNVTSKYREEPARMQAEAAERRMAAKAAADPNGDWAFHMHNYVECNASITRAIPTGINNMLASAANLEHQVRGSSRCVAAAGCDDSIVAIARDDYSAPD